MFAVGVLLATGIAVGSWVGLSVGVNAVTVTVNVETAVLPTVSVAVTVSTFTPACRGIPGTAQLVVPTAVPLPPRSLLHVTAATATSSVAVPAKSSVAALVV